MSRRLMEEKLLTLSQVKKILEGVGEEKLDQFQRRTLDYALKFSKVDVEAAESLVKKLIEEYGLEPREAIQIANCMPESVEELRVFLAGGRGIIEASKLEGMLALLNEAKSKK